jgi:hypothetical protein
MRMVRALIPSITVGLLVMMAAGVAYGLGAPAWIAYAASIVQALVLVVGYDRWERRRNPS